MSAFRVELEEKNLAMMLYEMRLAQYLESSKKLSSLEKHLYLFLDKDKIFNSETIAAALNIMHSTHSKAKGRMIALFNASHGSENVVCPVMHALFEKDKNGYARFLHLGTTRIWNADGTINEDKWQNLEAFIKSKQNDSNYLTLSTLKEYLKRCLASDQPDPHSGRNAFSLFSSKSTQSLAATAAWDEVFDRLACGWSLVEGKSDQIEPYITLDVVKEFFTDSPRAFLIAECGLLPVPKPQMNNLLGAAVRM